MVRRSLEFLFPPTCPGCGTPGSPFCAACVQRSLRVERFELRGASPPCAVLTLGRYEGPLRAAILACKRGRRDVARALGELLAERFAGRLGADTLLVPVPTSSGRRRARGFDQSAVLAAILAARAGVPVRRALGREVRRPAQHGRTRAERLADAQGRFRVGAVPHGERIVLIDDVVTTGATLRDGVRALRAAGATIGGAIVLARTVAGSNR